MERFRQTLDGTWKLSYEDHDVVTQKNMEIRTIRDIETYGLRRINAEVPGNFELALQDAGILPDLFFGTNPILLQDYENRHVWYFTTFTFDGEPDADTCLQFAGIDTISEIYLNGRLIGETDNMLIEHELPAAGLRKGLNEIVVHLKPVCVEARKFDTAAAWYAPTYYCYEGLYIRKAPHMYGWDIMPRIVSCGIWRSVAVVQKAPDRIENVFLYTQSIDRHHHSAILGLAYRVHVRRDRMKGYRLRIRGICEDSAFSEEYDLWHVNGKYNVTAYACKFWFPKSHGIPYLYDVTVELLYEGETVDTYCFRTGIRTIQLERTEVTDEHGSGAFCFYVNDERVFVKGTNWVPADAFHSRDKQRLPRMLALLDDIGCNMVRCWGGNVYEDHDFFDFCDERGILVWQDFAMACAIYPQDEYFSHKLEAEAVSVVKKLRNHPSLTLWAGDNECDDAYRWNGILRNPNENILNRKVLPGVLRQYDFTRPYLPSSPFAGEEGFQKGPDYLSENHLWGPRDYHKSRFYQNSLCHFASEIGYHGCPSPESIRRFISPEHLWPPQGNAEWIAHSASPETRPDSPFGSRNNLMVNQVGEFFEEVPDTLEDFAMASQFVQAEAYKFFIELFRTAKWRRTGIIWWNLIDGWPQFSDAVVDYYFNRKAAYDFIKRAQLPVHLAFREPDCWNIRLVACNDTSEDVPLTFHVYDMTDGKKVVLEGMGLADANGVRVLGEVRYSMSQQKFYLIEWKIGDKTFKSHYVAGTPPFRLEQYKEWLKEAGLFQVYGFADDSEPSRSIRAEHSR